MCFEDMRRIVEEQKCFSSHPGELFDGSQNRTGFPAFGDGNQKILRCHLQFLYLPRAEDGVIFKRFHRFDQRVIAAGHDALNVIGIFRTAAAPHRFEENTQSSGGAAAGKNYFISGSYHGINFVAQQLEFRGNKDFLCHLQHVAVD